MPVKSSVGSVASLGSELGSEGCCTPQAATDRHSARVKRISSSRFIEFPSLFKLIPDHLIQKISAENVLAVCRKGFMGQKCAAEVEVGGIEAKGRLQH